MPFKYKDHADVVARMVNAGVDEHLAETFFNDIASVGSTFAPVTTLAVRHGGELVTAEMAAKLLAKMDSGDVVELEVDIVSYRQKQGVPNRNYMRLSYKKGTLRSTAKSGVGMPFIADHQWRSLDARMGTIKRSSAEFNDDGECLFMMTLNVVTPRGVEGVLRGTIDRFSVGWAATGPVECSLCETPVFADCYHLPGEKVELDDDGKEVAIIEWVFTSADLIEVSAVNVPAVLGTGIEEVRASMARSTTPPAMPAKENRMNHAELCAKFGLPADTTEAELNAHIAKVAADSARVRELETQNATLAAEAAVREAQEQSIVLERTLIDLRTEGKLTANSAKVEAALRSMAAADFQAFLAYCESMPVIVPVGQQQAAQTTVKNDATVAPQPMPGIGGVQGASFSVPAFDMAELAANPYLPGFLAGLGLSNEDVAKFGPRRPMGVSLLDRDAYKTEE